MADLSAQKTPMPERPASVRSRNFDEVSLGYSPEQARKEAARCLGCAHKPCVAGCPVGVEIPSFIGKIREGDFEAAGQIIRQTNTLPAICGRVCPQESQCEALCVRGRKGEPVGIGRLERFAGDFLPENSAGTSQGSTAADTSQGKGIKMAVVGSGPAGLTCAGELCRRGYDVTIFEALHEAGGVLAYGIPEFRLPKAVVKREVDALLAMGVKLIKNCVIGRSLTVDELFAEGYKAVFIGSGAGLPSFLGIPGESLNGVYSANELLTRINLMHAHDERADTPLPSMRKAAVIGGGNVAMDAARCALRLGAESHIVYRRSREEMPARREEIHHAQEEGVEFHMLSGPVEILGDEKGRVCGLVLDEMELGAPDASGRRRPVVKPNSRYTLDCDCVVLAIGSSPNPLLRTTTPDLQADRRGCLVMEDEAAGKTTKMGVFAGGDAVTGAATVILAMGAGRSAAAAMDSFAQENESAT